MRSAAKLVTLGLLALSLLAYPAIPRSVFASDAGQFVLISDIHLNPFLGTDVDKELLSAEAERWPALYKGVKAPIATYGQDATVPLFLSALGDAAKRLAKPDFVVFPGDFLTHKLREKIAAVDPAATDAAHRRMAINTTLYVGAELQKTFEGVPILPTLGNTDSACGDYQIEPNGPYLAATWPMVEKMVGAARLADDAETTWKRGGYYSASHPAVKNATVLVLNNILWSERFSDACGDAEGDPGSEMLDWLETALSSAKAAEQTVWLLYHIPPGANAYNTAHSHVPGCRESTKIYWKPRFRTAFAKLIDRYGDLVKASFAGHIHRDSFRLLHTGATRPTVTTIAPAISPIFGNNPAYQVFRYVPNGARLNDKRTYYARNLESAAAGKMPLEWQFLYGFSKSYGGPYRPAQLSALAQELQSPHPTAARTLYARFYSAAHGNDPATDWPVFGCAPGNVTAADFIACRCRQ